MLDTTRFSENELAIFRMGADEARRFHAGSHLLHQDVFKAESDDWKLHVTYDDVDSGVELHVTFKRWYRRDGNRTTFTIPCGTAARAIQRAMRFIAQHPVSEPYCSVDY